MGKNKIPDRWEAYTPVGEPIPGTRFIAFKVPLHKVFVEEELKFTPMCLQTTLKERGLNLGLVIDLTFTDRYYDPKEFQTIGIQHEKIKTEGHVVPKKSVCKRLIHVVDKFLEENKDNDLLVGIHCTHGVNRTGYMLCRYMIDRLDFLPEKAISACGDARGYPIERTNYLDSLREGKRTYHNVPVVDSSGKYQNRNSHARRGQGHNNHNGFSTRGRSQPSYENYGSRLPNGGYQNYGGPGPMTFGYHNDRAPPPYYHGDPTYNQGPPVRGHGPPNWSHRGSTRHSRGPPNSYDHGPSEYKDYGPPSHKQHSQGSRSYHHPPRSFSYGNRDRQFKEPYGHPKNWSGPKSQSCEQSGFSVQRSFSHNEQRHPNKKARHDRSFNPYADY